MRVTKDKKKILALWTVSLTVKTATFFVTSVADWSRAIDVVEFSRLPCHLNFVCLLSPSPNKICHIPPSIRPDNTDQCSIWEIIIQGKAQFNCFSFVALIVHPTSIIQDAIIISLLSSGNSKSASLHNSCPCFHHLIRLRFDLDTDASEEQIANLLRLTERYCVVYQTLSHPAEISVLHRVVSR